MNKDNLIEFAKEQSVVFPEDSAMGWYLRETLKMLQAEPCEMTTEEYRQRMIQAFQNANCDELIAVCVLPTEKEFEHLEWLLKNHYKKEPCEDAVIRKDVIKAVDRHTFDTDDGLCLDEDISIILEELPPVKPVAKVEMEKHTDRQIYDGCILLMQQMVEYFQEYLEYLGYDLDKLDEDERFVAGMSNLEIVRQLFLCHTRNSGGCSTKDFCEKLGVDPYNSVKFEFEENEEA